MAGKIVKPEWKALPRRKSENAALQEIFWEAHKILVSLGPFKTIERWMRAA